MKYASKAGQQAARTMREEEAKAKKDAAFNQERGIAHIQSVLCFKKVPPVTPQIIEIEHSESEPEIQCISPKRPGRSPKQNRRPTPIVMTTQTMRSRSLNTGSRNGRERERTRSLL